MFSKWTGSTALIVAAAIYFTFPCTRVAHWYLRLPFWDWMVESYFPITLIHDDETQIPLTEKDRKYFFVYHPHGLWLVLIRMARYHNILHYSGLGVCGCLW